MSQRLEGKVAVVTGASKGLHAAGIPGGDFQTQMEAQTPLGRISQPQDVAPAVVFLASPEAWITGETLYVSGGLR
jgi:3-oxoacyl-[acyl-carrier protein] reductase